MLENKSLLLFDNLCLKFPKGKVFYNEKRQDIGSILRSLCKWKGVNLLEGEVCPDHIHMLLEIPPKFSISSFMGYLKGKSSLMIYEKYGNMEIQIQK